MASPGKPSFIVAGKPAYIVAETGNGDRPRLVTGTWTEEVFTNRDEAFAELADAHDAGFTELRVYQLSPCHVLEPLPGPGI